MPETVCGSNKNFDKQFCNEETSGKFVVDSVIPNLTPDTYPKTYEQNSEIHFHNEDIFTKRYQKVNVDKVTGENGKNVETMGLGDNFYVFFIYDETEIVHYIKENNEQRLDVGLLYIDNYDESLEQVDEVRRALLSALIDRKINKYMMKIDAITKKLEKDKYIFLFKHKYLSYLQMINFLFWMTFEQSIPERRVRLRSVWESVRREIPIKNDRNILVQRLIWRLPAGRSSCR